MASDDKLKLTCTSRLCPLPSCFTVEGKRGEGGQFSRGPLLGLGSGTLGSWNRALDILCREDSRPTACYSAIVEKTIKK